MNQPLELLVHAKQRNAGRKMKESTLRALIDAIDGCSLRVAAERNGVHPGALMLNWRCTVMIDRAKGRGSYWVYESRADFDKALKIRILLYYKLKSLYNVELPPHDQRRMNHDGTPFSHTYLYNCEEARLERTRKLAKKQEQYNSAYTAKKQSLKVSTNQLPMATTTPNKQTTQTSPSTPPTQVPPVTDPHVWPSPLVIPSSTIEAIITSGDRHDNQISKIACATKLRIAIIQAVLENHFVPYTGYLPSHLCSTPHFLLTAPYLSKSGSYSLALTPNPTSTLAQQKASQRQSPYKLEVTGRQPCPVCQRLDGPKCEFIPYQDHCISCGATAKKDHDRHLTLLRTDPLYTEQHAREQARQNLFTIK